MVFPDDTPANATLDRAVADILHVGDLVGFDHVDIGITQLTKGFEDVTDYPNQIAALLRAGVSDRDAAKIAGGNLLRHEVQVGRSAQMKAGNVPAMEEDVASLAPN